MRLWHYKMISFLPEAQLRGQWRECCAIAQEWASTRYLKHPLVKPLLNYAPTEFIVYCKLVMDEMHARGFNTYEYTEAKLKDNLFMIYMDMEPMDNHKHARDLIDYIWEKGCSYTEGLFPHWHNDEYFSICYYNLEEKFLCGCVPPTEWARFLEGGREYV